jgi:hypothetical protein
VCDQARPRAAREENRRARTARPVRGATCRRQTPEFFAQILVARDRLDPNYGSYYAQIVRANT